MTRLLQLLALSALLFVSACSDETDKDAKNKANEQTQQSKEETESKLEKLVIVSGETKQEFSVEIADTERTLYRGLMGRTSLAENSGLLLDTTIVPKDMEVAMWMKDTVIPLDILFIDENGTIYFIYENAEPYSTKAIYSPQRQRPRAVLEINAGQAAKYGIKVGDTVENRLLGNI